MVELIGDICQPSDLSVPIQTTTQADTQSGINIVSGLLIYNTTLGKLEVWNGTQFETVTSVAR